jgi:hypothetical protein
MKKSVGTSLLPSQYLMDDTAQTGTDPVPAELADGETEVAESLDPSPEEGVTSPEEPVQPKPQTVPYERLQTEARQKREAQEALAGLQKKLAELQGAPAKPQVSSADVERAKPLVEAAIQEKLTQLSALEDRLKSFEEREQARTKTEAEKEDNAKLQSALKDWKGTPTKAEEVKAQVIKWWQSGDPELKALAQSSYRVILREMEDMKAARLAKKPKNAPAVETSTAPEGIRKPSQKSSTVNPTNALAWEEHLKRGALEKMMETGEAE